MENLAFSLNATVPIFLMMVFGYFLRRVKLVNEPFLKVLDKFNFTVTLPALLFWDLANTDFTQMWDTRYVLYCFCVTLFCILITWLIAGRIMKNKGDLGELVQASYRGSAAVLGVAFIQNIYGNSGMAPLMIIGTVPLYNIAAVIVLSLTGQGEGKLDRKAMKKALIGIATNPIIISIFAGVIWSLIGIPFHPIAKKCITNLSGLATPLALIGLGGNFEGTKAIKKIKPTVAATIIKLFVWPAIFLPLAALLGFRDEKMVALLVMLGSPTTVSCYIMSRNMGHEGVLTSGTVVLATLVSSVSLTLWLFLLRTYGLI